MRQYDSSKTRVEPVFDWLYAKDPTGSSWLPQLLQLPAGGCSSFAPAARMRLEIVDRAWRSTKHRLNEKKLTPPVSLLSWLIRNLHAASSVPVFLSADAARAAKRGEALNGDAEAVRQALALLRGDPEHEIWHVFEGESCPDVYLETPDLIVVVEGKRTERAATTKTRWMDGRHQMWRHIDAAWEIRGKKQVVGFFILEESGGRISDRWRADVASTDSDEVLLTSFPHRGSEELKQIRQCFLGYTTWQRIAQDFSIPPGALEAEH